MVNVARSVATSSSNRPCALPAVMSRGYQDIMDERFCRSPQRFGPFCFRSLLLLCLVGHLSFISASSLSAQDDGAQPAQPKTEQEKEILNKALQGLKDGLKNLFQQAPFNEDEEVEEGEIEVEEAPTIDIARDPHAPVKLEISSLWERTEKRIAQKEFNQGFEFLEHILTQADDALIHTPDKKLISIRLLAQEKLSQMPDEFRQNFIQRFDLLSQQELEKANESNKPGDFYEVATRYLLTDAGQKAANWLGAYHFDHGRYGLAAYWFNLLRERNSRLTQNFNWQSKLLLTLTAAQKKQEASTLLNEINRQYPEESAELQNLLQMWNDKIAINFNSQEPLDEWMVPFGTAGRNGVAAGGDPLLMPRWNYQLTNDHLLQGQISKLVESLMDDQHSIIMPAFPVFCEGYAAVKTLRGLAVIDIASGKLQWETADEYSPESLVSMMGQDNAAAMQQRFIGGAGNRVIVNRGRGFNQMLNQFDAGMPAEYHPLARLIFKNSTYGNISSDSQRVYTLEDLATFGGPESDWGGFRNGSFVDPFHRDWKTNKLVAYDLRSGRKHWVVGGSENGDEFDYTLAGFYFHSTPVIYHDELLVIGEKQNEIYLLALAPQSGALLWKQLVAFADSDISIDILRRYFGGQVAVSDGVIICPTVAGWIVAVDAMTHSVLWANRYHRGYLDDESARSWRTGYDISDQLGNWRVTPPFINQNCVVYAPPEGNSLNCYDLQTGELLWGSHSQVRDTRREDALFVAGVWDNSVLVVEQTQVVSYDLKQGKRLWKHAFTEDLGRPAGFGVMNEGSYYLPFDSGQLLKLNLENGELAGTFYLGGQSPQATYPLGNLTMYQGMLLSYSWKGLQNFEQRRISDTCHC
ncbi:MAG: PQQ-binding-like beta-propeller repeat protein [Planctomycetaceae bacterium]